MHSAKDSTTIWNFESMPTLTKEQNMSVFPSAFPISTTSPITATREPVELNVGSFSPPSSPVGVYISQSSNSTTSTNGEDVISFSTLDDEGATHKVLIDETMLSKPTEFEATKKDDLAPPAIPPQVNVTEKDCEEPLPDKESPSAATKETDLSFLIGCFPDQDPSYLQKLLTKYGDVENALSIALDSTGMTVPLDNYNESYEEVKDQRNPKRLKNTENVDCSDDEKIAQLLQEEEGGKPVAMVTPRTPATGSHDDSVDDNLVLTLSDSFAAQLQSLFGRVDEHIPHEGIVFDITCSI